MKRLLNNDKSNRKEMENEQTQISYWLKIRTYNSFPFDMKKVHICKKKTKKKEYCRNFMFTKEKKVNANNRYRKIFGIFYKKRFYMR